MTSTRLPRCRARHLAPLVFIAAMTGLAACETAPTPSGSNQTSAGVVPGAAKNFVNTPSVAKLAAAPQPAPPVIGRHPEFERSEIQFVDDDPFSTFSLEVDTAAYSVVRRYLRGSTMPPADAVRIEEMLNYFDYSYPVPEQAEGGLRPSLSVFPSPWKKDWAMLRIGVKAWTPPPAARKPLNLVLLLDVSGSMKGPDRLDLLKRSLPILFDGLGPDDRVALVTYANEVDIRQKPTTDHAKLLRKVASLRADGGTAGAAALQTAYGLAEEYLSEDRENRVLLMTDGDFNVGITDPRSFRNFVAEKRRTGIGLSVLGLGAGNFNDALVQILVQAGNGTAAYIDDGAEARRLFQEGGAGLLHTVAADVKVQVEFNPDRIAAYRLIGYETRALETQDFLDEQKDAGEIGAGHAVTALYEVLPVEAAAKYLPQPRYPGNGPAPTADSALRQEWALVKLAFKSKLNGEQTVVTAIATPDMLHPAVDLSPDDSLAAAVAAFGGKLRREGDLANFSYDEILRLVQTARGEDPDGARAELMQLVKAAAALDG
ncbi:vWA domain-containing protein [Hwanghaeella sp.]|uniref:vWA domain-containing protein n=1 Tax=Hwanghaeella sp. TaxID=2605943 RepID=UPI003CCC13FF